MGLFDRFRSKWDKRDSAKTRKPKHTVSSKERADEAKKAAFRSVPGAAGSAPSKQPAAATKKAKREDTGTAYRILRRPIVTEKSTRLAAMSQYVFEVHPGANKIEVRRAVKSLYGVEPIRVNMLVYDGKTVRYGRSVGQTKHWKKAVITLKSGQKIDILES